jgi:hypothetical protein
MRINIFKSKKATSKGNTIKKADPVDGRQARRDFYDQNDQNIVDISTVSDWVKESVVVSSDDADHEGRAVLKEPKEPTQVKIVNGDAAGSETHSQEAIAEDSGSTNSTGADENDQAHQKPQREMLDLVIGQRDPSSRYFSQRYIRVPASTMSSLSIPPTTPSESSDNNSLQVFPDLDPHAMELYRIWFHTGEIPTRIQRACCSSPEIEPQYLWQAHWPLINAHILGSALNAHEFSDQVMDLLQEKLSTAGRPDLDTISHLFSANNSSISLKCFVVDQCINAGTECLAGIDVPSLPPAFVHLMLERALHRLCSATSFYRTPECEYHTHKTPETCYKQNMSSKELRKTLRLQLDREKSLKDAEDVVTNAKVNGIKTVDWEERRAEANKALWEQTGRRHCSFRRLDGRQSGTTAASDGDGLPDVGQTGSNVTSLLGTMQTNGAVDGITIRTSNRSPPSPPLFLEPPTDVADSAESVPEYKTTAATLENGIRPTILANGTSSLSSACSIKPKPEPDLQEHLRMFLELERKLECPGAFPVSRRGSERSPL